MMLGECPIVCTQVAAAHAVGRIRRAADLVVLQADRVPDFVRDHELEQAPHQRIGERESCARADRPAPPA